jgi:hypothetical protein
MPHRIAELEGIAAELAILVKRATDIGEHQLALTIVSAMAISGVSRSRISAELSAGEKSGLGLAT